MPKDRVGISQGFILVIMMNYDYICNNFIDNFNCKHVQMRFILSILARWTLMFKSSRVFGNLMINK